MASNFLEMPEDRLNILQRLCRMIGGKSKDNGVDVSVQVSMLQNLFSFITDAFGKICTWQIYSKTSFLVQIKFITEDLQQTHI